MIQDVHKITKNYKMIFFIVYIMLGIIFLFKIPNNLSFKLMTDYLLILFSYFFVVGIWGHYIFKKGIYIFEPSTMVLLLTIISFSIEPLISITINDLDVNGFYVYAGCKKATIIYIIATVSFIFCYYNKIICKKKEYYNCSIDKIYKECIDISNKNRVLILAWFFAIIGVLVSLVDLLLQGYSIQYILSLGVSGTMSIEDSSLGVFINLRYCMIPAFIYLYKYSRVKWPSYILTIIALSCMFMRNKRWVMIIIIMAPIVYKYVEKNKKPKTIKIIVVSIVLILLISVMQFMRYDATTSLNSVSWENFTLLEVWKGFSGNFDLYKTLYGAVVYFPQKHFYTLGQQMIYLTIITCIPRAIWPSKPISILEVLKPQWLGEGAVRGAWAYAQITEFYVEFGIIGAVLLMSCYGIICRRLKQLYINKKSVHNLVLYSFTFPMLMQFTNRGYMPINFWAYIFMLVPWLIIKKLDR